MIGVDFDSDQEIESDSDDEFHSDTEAQPRLMVNYDIDTMFEIVRKRDFNNWKLCTISNRYKQISTNSSTGRSQITRYMIGVTTKLMINTIDISYILFSFCVDREECEHTSKGVAWALSPDIFNWRESFATKFMLWIKNSGLSTTTTFRTLQWLKQWCWASRILKWILFH